MSIYIMYPVLISGIVSLAGDVLRGWNRVAEQKALQNAASPTAATGAPAVDFDALLKKSTSVVPGAIDTTTVDKQIRELTDQLLQSPELQAALTQGNPTQPVKCEISADGNISVLGVSNQNIRLALTPETQNLARQLHALKNSQTPNQQLPQFAQQQVASVLPVSSPVVQLTLSPKV